MAADCRGDRQDYGRYLIRRPLYNIDKTTQARLRYIAASSGTKLEKTSLSTDGGRAPAYVLYILYN